MVKRGWDAQVLGEAPYKFKSALEAVKTLRAQPKANDQYLPPFVIVDDSGNAVGPVLDGDAVVTINFRADRRPSSVKLSVKFLYLNVFVIPQTKSGANEKDIEF